MSDLSLEAYVRFNTFVSGLLERARENRGQTAADAAAGTSRTAPRIAATMGERGDMYA